MTATPANQDQIIESLNASFEIPGVAQIVSGSGGLPKIQITMPQASAEIYLHGAHLTSWIPSGGKEVIFLSEKAQFQDGKAIRGGVPICFPWFNAKADNTKAPSHGFVRTKTWDLDSIVQEGNAVSVSLTTRSDESTRKWWPHKFRATQRITIGAQLELALTVTNTGSTPLTFEEALHTYYRVGQIREVRIVTLDGVTYQDNTEGNHEKLQQGDNLFTQRTDNAYLNTQHDLDLIDASLNRRILIGKRHSNNTVVWNPWQELAKGMADLGDDEWQNFVCVEAANIRASAITLQPEAQHTMTVIVKVEELS
jgi:glucose-6-phosphate 1-epimerase